MGGLLFCNEAHRAIGAAAKKCKRLFSGQVKQKVPLPYAASKQNLYRINAAGVIFSDTDHLLVIRKIDLQKLSGISGRLKAKSKSAALMSVKSDTLFPKAILRLKMFHLCLSLCYLSSGTSISSA